MQGGVQRSLLGLRAILVSLGLPWLRRTGFSFLARKTCRASWFAISLVKQRRSMAMYERSRSLNSGSVRFAFIIEAFLKSTIALDRESRFKKSAPVFTE